MNVRDHKYQLRPGYITKITRPKKIVIKSKPLIRPARPAGDPDLNSERLYYKNILRYRLLTKEEQSGLASLIQKGNNKAARDLILANLRFVVSVANKYVKRGMPKVDLIQEGNVGLIKAVKRIIEKHYNSEKGAFTTYEVQWIRHAIVKAISESGRTIRLPLNVQADAYQLFLIEGLLIQKYGREPTADEIARCTRDIFLKKLETKPNVAQFMRLSEISAAQVREIQMKTKDSLSLETPLKNNMKEKNMGEETHALADRLKDETCPPPDEKANNEMLRRNIDKALLYLPPREKDVLVLYYGLGEDPEQRTLDEIGKELSLTREGVRKIKAKAEKNLAKNLRLLPFLKPEVGSKEDQEYGSWVEKCLAIGKHKGP